MKNAARLFSIPLLAFTAAAASIELRDDASLTDIAPDAVGNMNVTEAIVNATDSGIDLSALPVAASAINYIANLTAAADTPAMRKRALVNPGNGIDVHCELTCQGKTSWLIEFQQLTWCSLGIGAWSH